MSGANERERDNTGDRGKIEQVIEREITIERERKR